MHGIVYLFDMNSIIVCSGLVKIVMDGMGSWRPDLDCPPCLSVGATALFVVKLKPEE